MNPDEKVFRGDIEKGPFQSGLDLRRWRLLSIEWPYAFLSVHAASRRKSPDEYAFRFECSNYPQAAPTAQPWDVSQSIPLELDDWPTGRSRVPLAFNPSWKNGQCLYLPCDRLSLEGHDVWRAQHPSMIWSTTSDITHYLRIVYELLNSNDYTGTRRA